MNRTGLAGFAAIATALLLGGCASTTLTNAWSDSEYKGGALPMLRETMRRQGLDGVFVTRLVRMDTQTTYSPGYGWGVPAVGYRQSLHGDYNVARAPYVGAPEVGVYELAVLETTLWSAASSKLVWSATTETLAPENVRTAADDFSKVVIGELKARKLL